MSNILRKFSARVFNTLVTIRHPESIALKRKGIKFEEYRNLKRFWITKFGISTVIDIGANEGQFAKLAREVFPEAQIYSFEPLPDCFEKLGKALPGDKNFRSFNLAIGSKEGSLEFFRSAHTPSSSFLRMEDAHKDAFPESSDGQSDKPLMVNIKTLDSVLEDIGLADGILLKIDVQGYELEAIEGSKGVMGRCDIVIIEMSFQKLYKDQPLFHDVYEKMYNLGFEFRGGLNQMLHPETHEVVQMDAIFVKRK